LRSVGRQAGQRGSTKTARCAYHFIPLRINIFECSVAEAVRPQLQSRASFGHLLYDVELWLIGIRSCWNSIASGHISPCAEPNNLSEARAGGYPGRRSRLQLEGPLVPSSTSTAQSTTLIITSTLVSSPQFNGVSLSPSTSLGELRPTCARSLWEENNNGDSIIWGLRKRNNWLCQIITWYFLSRPTNVNQTNAD